MTPSESGRDSVFRDADLPGAHPASPSRPCRAYPRPARSAVGQRGALPSLGRTSCAACKSVRTRRAQVKAKTGFGLELPRRRADPHAAVGGYAQFAGDSSACPRSTASPRRRIAGAPSDVGPRTRGSWCRYSACGRVAHAHRTRMPAPAIGIACDAGVGCCAGRTDSRACARRELVQPCSWIAGTPDKLHSAQERAWRPCT